MPFVYIVLFFLGASFIYALLRHLLLATTPALNSLFSTLGGVFEGGLLLVMGIGLLWAMFGALRPASSLFFARNECKTTRHAIFFPLLLSANAFFMMDFIADAEFMAGAVSGISLLITMAYWLNIRAPRQTQTSLTNIKVIGKSK